MDLQHAIRRRRPFESAAEEVHLNLARAHAILAANVAAVLKPEGLGEASYNVLRILAGTFRHPVDGRDDLACGEIAGRMVTRVPDVTRLLDRLEAKGWIERHRDAGDRRVVRARVTPAGLELAERLRQPLIDAHERALGHLASEDLAALNDLLARLRAPHEAPPDRPSGSAASVPRAGDRPAP